jgi:hypothetical protein
VALEGFEKEKRRAGILLHGNKIGVGPSPWNRPAVLVALEFGKGVAVKADEFAFQHKRNRSCTARKLDAPF